MRGRPSRSTRTDTLFPDPPLFRSMGSPSPQIGCRPVYEPCWIQRFLAASPTCHPGQASVSEREPGPMAVTRSGRGPILRSEEHTSELQSLMRISYAVFCLKKNNNHCNDTIRTHATNTTVART